MASSPLFWQWPWFSWLGIPVVVAGFRRGSRGAAVMAAAGLLMAGVWRLKGCAPGWMAGPVGLLLFLPVSFFLLERKLKEQSDALGRREREVVEQVKALRARTETVQTRVREREEAIQEIVQLYQLSKEFLATLEESEALKIVEDSVTRFFPQMRLADRQAYLQKVRGVLARGDISGEDLIQAVPAAAADFSLRERWGIVSDQLALGLQRICLYRKVQESATHDGLTGLLVRRFFRERLEDEIERGRRRASPLTFLMVDLDHFKSVNDTYGHLVGDAVLREAAAIIRGCVREMDLIGRYGGEEFAVALPETGPVLGLQIAERIRKTIEEKSIPAYDEQVFISVSIGVSFFPADAASAEDLIEKADQAMYRAKSLGRNRTVRFASISESASS